MFDHYTSPQPPKTLRSSGLGSSAFARHYLRNLFDFFSCGYLDVSVPRVSLLYTMDSCTGDGAFTTAGFPHSDILGSKAICASPGLFAAYRVLHRLLVPRHSPYALSNLTLAGPPDSIYAELVSQAQLWSQKLSSFYESLPLKHLRFKTSPLYCSYVSENPKCNLNP
jgi:hypothetical protein